MPLERTTATHWIDTFYLHPSIDSYGFKHNPKILSSCMVCGADATQNSVWSGVTWIKKGILGKSYIKYSWPALTGSEGNVVV